MRDEDYVLQYIKILRIQNMLQPETLAPSLFNRLERFFQQDKIDFFKINSLKRDAKQLMNVSPILAYTALGMISALENKRDEVLSYYKTAQQLNAGFGEHHHFAISFSHVFDFENAIIATHHVFDACDYSNKEHLHVACERAMEYLLLNKVIDFNKILKKLDNKYQINDDIEKLLKLLNNPSDSILQKMMIGIYQELAQYQIRTIKMKLVDNNEYYLIKLYLNGCNDMKQLAQIQQEVNLYLADFEEEHHIDLSALSFALRLHQEPA